MCRHLVWRAAIALGVLPGLVWAGDLPKQFTLGRYVPDTCWLFESVAHNPERAFIDQHWARVFEALRRSGLDDEARDLVLQLLPEPDRAEFLQQWSQLVALFKVVSWDELAQQEVAFAMRLSPVPAHLLLLEGAPGSGEKNAAALAKILAH